MVGRWFLDLVLANPFSLPDASGFGDPQLSVVYLHGIPSEALFKYIDWLSLDMALDNCLCKNRD